MIDEPIILIDKLIIGIYVMSTENKEPITMIEELTELNTGIDELISGIYELITRVHDIITMIYELITWIITSWIDNRITTIDKLI